MTKEEVLDAFSEGWLTIGKRAGGTIEAKLIGPYGIDHGTLESATIVKMLAGGEMLLYGTQFNAKQYADFPQAWWCVPGRP